MPSFQMESLAQHGPQDPRDVAVQSASRSLPNFFLNPLFNPLKKTFKKFLSCLFPFFFFFETLSNHFEHVLPCSTLCLLLKNIFGPFQTLLS